VEKTRGTALAKSKIKQQNANASQSFPRTLLFLSLFSGCSGNAPHGTKHFDHYVIEVFAMNGQKEPLDGFLSVEVEAKPEVQISSPKNIIPTVRSNGNSTVTYTKPHRGSQITDDKAFTLDEDRIRGRYFLVFPAKIKRQDIATIKFFIDELSPSGSGELSEKWKPILFDFSKEKISHLQPAEQTIKYGGSGAPCERFDNPVGKDAIHFLWNFITGQETAYAYSKKLSCKLTFRSRDQIHLIFEPI
tara:strand:- start:737 stop:1474 length:738 start_codon:yes stop_codon:yes gene_type:complete